MLVDAGGVFGNPSVQDKFKAITALEAMSIIGYDVLNVGDRDLIYGLNFLQEEARNVHYPLISASWVDKDHLQPLFKPYLIKELPGVRVAILGLSAGMMHATSKMQGIVAAPLVPAETVKKYIEELKPQADLIVLLADVGYQGAMELARQVPGIDIIITSRDGQYIFSPGKVNDTLVLEGGNQGRYLGQIKIFLDAHKKIARYEGTLITLDDKVTDNTSVRQFLDKRQQEAEKLLGPAAGTPASSAAARTASPSVTATVISPPSAPVPLGYVNNSACFRCHQEMVIKWEKTLHAKAFGALKVKSQWENPDCLRCHTTGFGHASGFISREKTPQYMHVQCEACHGPGSQHVQFPQKGYGPVTEATCISCHNKEQDPGFQYQAALKRGVH